MVILIPALAFADAPTGKTEIVVATYNIRYANPNDGKDVWEHRKATVAKYLAGKDIVGLQEVTESQYDDLKAGLPQFATYGIGRDDGKSDGEHAPIFYRKDRFEAIDQGTFWLSETPQKAGTKGWDAALPRICTWMILRDRRNQKEFCVANTHFDHQGKIARTESAKLLADRVDELPEELPIVLMGDFNCLPDSEPYQSLVGALADVRTKSASPPQGPNSTWNGFDAIIAQRIIDHVFVRNFAVIAVQVDDPKTETKRFGSDHLPVRVTLDFDKP